MGIKKKVKSVMAAARRDRIVPVLQQVPEGDLLAGKVALVTGGSGGIGTAVAQRLLCAGAKVVLAGTNHGKLESCARSLRGGDRLCCQVVDLLDVSSLPSVVAECASMFPEGRIDILVNCAGVIDHAKFLDVTEDAYDKVLDINLKGTFFVCQAVARHMVEHGVKGHILNLSSASALRPAQGPYGISKWGVSGLTKGMADALVSYGITVNAIGPGPTATGMLGKTKGDAIDHATNPAGRYATPEEIANLALFMVSGMGDLIVGDTVYVSGGGGTVSLHR